MGQCSRSLVNACFSEWKARSLEVHKRSSLAAKKLSNAKLKASWKSEFVYVIYHMWYRYAAHKRALRLGTGKPTFSKYIAEWELWLDDYKRRMQRKAIATRLGIRSHLRFVIHRWRVHVQACTSLPYRLEEARLYRECVILSTIVAQWNRLCRERGNLRRSRDTSFARWRLWSKQNVHHRHMEEAAREKIDYLRKHRFLRMWHSLMEKKLVAYAYTNYILMDPSRRLSLLTMAYAIMGRTPNFVATCCWRKWRSREWKRQKSQVCGETIQSSIPATRLANYVPSTDPSPPGCCELANDTENGTTLTKQHFDVLSWKIAELGKDTKKPHCVAFTIGIVSDNEIAQRALKDSIAVDDKSQHAVKMRPLLTGSRTKVRRQLSIIHFCLYAVNLLRVSLDGAHILSVYIPLIQNLSNQQHTSPPVEKLNLSKENLGVGGDQKRNFARSTKWFKELCRDEQNATQKLLEHIAKTEIQITAMCKVTIQRQLRDDILLLNGVVCENPKKQEQIHRFRPLVVPVVPNNMTLHGSACGDCSSDSDGNKPVRSTLTGRNSQSESYLLYDANTRCLQDFQLEHNEALIRPDLIQISQRLQDADAFKADESELISLKSASATVKWANENFKVGPKMQCHKTQCAKKEDNANRRRLKLRSVYDESIQEMFKAQRARMLRQFSWKKKLVAHAGPSACLTGQNGMNVSGRRSTIARSNGPLWPIECDIVNYDLLI